MISDLPEGSYAFFEGDIFSIAKAVDTIIERSLVLCVTSRSTTLRVATPALIKAAKGRNLLRLMDANRLSSTELNDFHDLIDSMAFWPNDLNDLARSQRLTKLESDYKQNISAIILKIFENQKVRSEIMTQWSAAQASLKPVMDHFIIVSYMMIIDIVVPPYLVNEFQWMDYRALSHIQSDIIDLDSGGRIRFGNSIIAEFLLSRHKNRDDVIGAVVRFCQFVSGHIEQRSYQWIVRRLLRYWNLSRLFDSATLPSQVLDRASYIPAVRSDPLFWVQYSIAQMENGNFLPALRFLARL